MSVSKSASKGVFIIRRLLLFSNLSHLSSSKSSHPHFAATIRNLGAEAGAGWSDHDEGSGSSRRRDNDGAIPHNHFPASPIPNRPLRGERPTDRGGLPARPPFEGPSNHSDDKEYQKSQFQGRPLKRGGTRGEIGGARKEGQPDNDHLFHSKLDNNLEHQSSPFKSLAGDDDQAGQSFLEKFKLGFDGKENQNSQENTLPHVPQNEPVSPQVPENSDEIFRKMKETGLIPNAVAMLDGLCKDGLVQEAMKLFGLMREKGTIPEVVIYTAVVEGFCKAHKFEDAKRIFRKMQNNEISPNAFSYTVLIQGLCKGKCLDDALDFSVEMLEAGHSPNVGTFTTLINCFCEDKGVEEAESIVRRLREKGFCVNDNAVREHLDKKGPFSPLVWKAIFGEKSSQRLF